MPTLPPTSRRHRVALVGARLSAVCVRVPQRGDKRTLMETCAATPTVARPAQGGPRGRPDAAQQGVAGAAGLPRPRRRPAPHRVLRRPATCRAPTSLPRWWSSRTVSPARASTAVSSSGGPPRATTVPSPSPSTTPPRCGRVLTRRSGATSRTPRGRATSTCPRVVGASSERRRPRSGLDAARRTVDERSTEGAKGASVTTTSPPASGPSTPRRADATLRLPAQPRRSSTADCRRSTRAGRARRARHRGGRPRRPRQAPRGGVAAPEDHPVILRARARPLPASSGCATRPPVRHHLPRQRRSKAMTTSSSTASRARRQSPEGAAAPVRFGQTTPRRGHHGHHGRTGHRPVACIGGRQHLA